MSDPPKGQKSLEFDFFKDFCRDDLVRQIAELVVLALMILKHGVSALG